MAKQEINITPEQYRKFLQEDEAKIDSYNSYYSKFKVPKPTPPTKEELSFWNLAGLESSIFVLSGLGAATLSAIRTGGLFFLMEVLLVKKYDLPELFGTSAGIAALITSLLAFEGTLIGIGLVRGRESGKIKVSTTSLVVSLLTVGLASIFSSFTIVTLSENWQLAMNITLALVTGIASSITAFLSFENVGFIRNDVENKRKELIATHSKNYKIWEEGMMASYNLTRKTISSRAMTDYVQVETPSVPSPQIDQKKKSKSELAYDFVQEYYLQNNSIPTNQKVADASGVSIGSAYKAIGDFVISNKEELIFKNLVTQDDVNKLLSKRGVENNQDTYNVSYQKITDFIRSNESFPKSDEIARLVIPLDDVARFVLENKDGLLTNNIVDEKIVQDAQNHLNK